MKMRMIAPMLALAALAACGDKDGDTANGGVDTTSTMAPPAPMGTDSMAGMSGMPATDSAAGAGQTDTLVKVDSTKKM